MDPLATAAPEKLRGGYYTAPDVAAFLARFVAAARPRRVLEPSCGDGAFLAALAAVVSRATAVEACEIEPGEAAKARRRAAALKRLRVRVHAADFLEWALEGEPRAFDAAIGNPPFIRYQYLPEKAQTLAEQLFRRLALPFTRHTNAWVPFVLASLHHLRPGGRLALVVPAELLHVLHARALRDRLLAECSRVVVVDPEEILFGETLQGTVLLLAEKGGGPGALGIVRADRSILEADPEALFRRELTPAADLGPKWMPALLTSREREVLRAVKAPRFEALASVDVGIVTGANAFFLVPDSVVAAHELEAFARPMFGRSEHVRGVVYDRADHEENRARGLPAWFLDFGEAPRGRLPRGARRWLAEGEAQGLPARYKCRIRSPWWRVPSVHAAPVSLLKRCHHVPRLVANRLAALTTDTAYRIVPRPGVPGDELVASFVNSVTALGAELEGRHYGGGVLELVPSEIERLPVPLSGAADLAALDALVRSGAPPEALLAAQDARVLATLLSPADAATLREAWSRLRRRRQRGAAPDA